MSTYAIGDIQGCYDELIDLLDKIAFDPEVDTLWFTGDLINRGPQSLKALRFVMQLGDRAITVLGNHDLHLLATAHDKREKNRKDTLDDILAADDLDDLLDWIRCLPLLHSDKTCGYTLIHAGLPPQWDLDQSKRLAREVTDVLASDNYLAFLDHMYGDQPDHWQKDLDGWDRLRFIINAFTRMRYCTAKGVINLKEKGPPGSQQQGHTPWFTVEGRKTGHDRIIFGHWSTVHLGNIRNFQKYNVYPLDTGCLWGGRLSALRLEDKTWFSVPSRQPGYRDR